MPSSVAYDVEVSGDLAHVANGLSGLQVVDVSNADAPAIMGWADTPRDARGVAVSGTYVYVATINGFLYVVDVANPTVPTIVTSIRPGVLFQGRGVAISGEYAYVVGPGALWVVDISVPALPVNKGFVNTRVRGLGVAVSGDYAYVAARTSGLAVIDVSTPEAPAVMGGVGMTDMVVGSVAVSGNDVYLATNFGVGEGFFGLQIVDVSNPVLPVLVGSVGLPDGWTSGVVASESEVYFAAGPAGWQIIRPQCLVPSEMLVALASIVESIRLAAGIERSLLASLEAAGQALKRGNDGAARGQLNAFVHQVNAQRGRHIDAEDADALIQSAEAIMALLGTGGGPLIGGGKWQTARDTPDDTFGTVRLSASSTAPLDRSTTIRYELPVPALVDLAVYDVQGRRVRDFPSVPTAAGQHAVLWDGRDGSGTRVAAGVYFVRLVASDEAQTRKVVLLGGK